MKRSNRLMLVLGVLLAVVAFGGVMLFGAGSGGAKPAPPQTVAVVVAAVDLTLGTALDAAVLTTAQQPVADATDTYRDPAQVVGHVVRRTITKGEALRSTDFQPSAQGSVDVTADLKPGHVAMAVSVPTATGVGTFIQAGDFVDVLLSIENQDAKFPVVIVTPPGTSGSSATSNSGAPWTPVGNVANNTSIKVLVQNVQVLATTATTPSATNAGGGNNATTLPEKIVVVLSVTPQQSEMVRFAEVDGNLTLLLRSPGDVAAADETTTGVTLRELVDKHGVLPPRVVVSQFP